VEWRESGRIALNSFNYSDLPLWTESEVWIKRQWLRNLTYIDPCNRYLNEVDLRSRISVKSVEIGVATLRKYSASREHSLK
jgi:hypothetical protein